MLVAYIKKTTEIHLKEMGEMKFKKFWKLYKKMRREKNHIGNKLGFNLIRILEFINE